MHNQKLIKSLAIAFQTIDQDYPYAVGILKKMGYQPEFPSIPRYLQLWAWVSAGEILGEDVRHWKPLLQAETERLAAIEAEYQPKINSLKAAIAD